MRFYLIGGEKPKQSSRVTVSDKPRMVRVRSKTKVCGRCHIFCMEIKAIFPAGGAKRYTVEQTRRTGRFSLPEAKLECPNGCHLKESWGWRDLGDFKPDQIRAW